LKTTVIAGKAGWKEQNGITVQATYGTLRINIINKEQG